jgi:uncharacterized protein YbbC (DUF1343 family)
MDFITEKRSATVSKLLCLILLLFCSYGFCATPTNTAAGIIPGAEQTEAYIPLLKGKRVAVFANNTSRVGNKHLVDVLLKNGIHVTKIFAPEHGFRGKTNAGIHIHDTVDDRTGLPIVSLYGEKLAPTAQDLKNVDVIVFDVQDVGVRFYTYKKLWKPRLKMIRRLSFWTALTPMDFMLMGQCWIQNINRLPVCNRFRLSMG